MEKHQKENFYVFLDFDGVLYDIEYLIKQKFKNNEKLFRYAPDSIDALNTLFDQLSTKYNPHLVISSFWRLKFPMTIKLLKKNGVNIENIQLSKTYFSLTPFKRGLEINRFLKENGNSKNFIIIDDHKFDYNKYFPKDKVIKTSIINNRLTEDKLNNALIHYGLTSKSKDIEMLK